MRVLVDANVLVSALAFPRSVPATAVQILLREHTLLVTDTILAEVERTLDRRFPGTLDAWRAFIEAGLVERLEPGQAAGALPAVRDPKDVHVLEAAAQPGVDGLLTGDRDFDTPAVRAAITVWSAAELVALLDAEHPTSDGTGEEDG